MVALRKICLHLIPGICFDLKSIFVGIIKEFEMRYSWIIQVVPKSSDSIHKETERWRMQHDDGGRDESNTSTA